ncbi:MAG: aminoglycoside adenylyltransferase domain-containing protein [Rubrobacter sp.]
MGITPDSEIDVLLRRLTRDIRRSLDHSLVGLYLYGSLASSDFDPERSDIDLVAVVSSDVNGYDFDRLDSMQGRIIEDHPAWDDRIEVAYVSAAALRKFKTETSEIAVVSPGEPFHFKEAGRDWLMNWYMVREIGVTLFGPSPLTLIPEISSSEFVEAVREHSGRLAEWVYEMHHRGAQSYAVLTMCRALYTHTHGEQVSKERAALWARGYLPQWAPLIERAWIWRSEDQDEGADDVEETFPEVVRFVHDVVGRIAGARDQDLRAPD